MTAPTPQATYLTVLREASNSAWHHLGALKSLRISSCVISTKYANTQQKLVREFYWEGLFLGSKDFDNYEPEPYDRGKTLSSVTVLRYDWGSEDSESEG